MVRTHSGCPPPPAQIVQPLVWRTVRSKRAAQNLPDHRQLGDERLARLDDLVSRHLDK
jgi:hypothetical protein